MQVVENNLYENILKIEKLECVGHIHKLMGSRFRRFKTANAGRKLLVEKAVGNQGRLTDQAINNIQKYYSLAIRRNVGNLSEMTQAVWAEFFHPISTNETLSLGLCSPVRCMFLKT